MKSTTKSKVIKARATPSFHKIISGCLKEGETMSEFVLLACYKLADNRGALRAYGRHRDG